MVKAHESWSNMSPTGAPALPPRKLSQTNSPQPVESIAPRLQNPVPDPCLIEQADWYWGDITRDYVQKKLSNKPDGTFLIRNASNKAGEYTLTLRKGGSNKLIKIYQKDEKFGFTEPFTFSSVIELVNYYRKVSLSQYNETLDIKLLYPVSRFKQDEAFGPYKGLKLDELWAYLIDLHKEMLNITKLYEEKSKKFQDTMAGITIMRTGLQQYLEVNKMFEDQLTKHEKCLKNVERHEADTVVENIEIVKERIKLLLVSKAIHEDQLYEDVESSQQLERDMYLLKQQSIEVNVAKDNCIGYIFTYGVTVDAINDVLTNTDWNTVNPSDVKLPQCVSHLDESTWLLKSCSRAHAERLLNGKRNGTFLIRPSRTGKSALSIVCNGVVNHCIVNETPKGLFGFAEPYNIYSTLKDLVMHYSQNSLEEHNDSMTVMLAFPVFAENDKK